MNTLAFSKIMKKYDKVLFSKTRRLIFLYVRFHSEAHEVMMIGKFNLMKIMAFVLSKISKGWGPPPSPLLFLSLGWGLDGPLYYSLIYIG